MGQIGHSSLSCLGKGHCSPLGNDYQYSMQDDDRHATPEKGLWGDSSPKRAVFVDTSPGGPPSGGDPFLEPLHGWGTGRASHSPAVMASPTAVSMELTGSSQDGLYGRAEDMTGLSVLSGEMPAGSTGAQLPGNLPTYGQPHCSVRETVQ